MIPNHEILGAQQLLAYMKKVSFSSRPRVTVSHLWAPGHFLSIAMNVFFKINLE